MLLMPVLIADTVDSLIWGPIFTFVPIFGMFSLNFIGAELENPFGDDDNDLDILELIANLESECVEMLRMCGDDAAATAASANYNANSDMALESNGNGNGENKKKKKKRSNSDVGESMDRVATLAQQSLDRIRVLEADGQLRREQSAPSKPGAHEHAPLTHTPRPWQSDAHDSSAQPTPTHPWSHSHAPSTQRPCPEQLRSHAATTREQSLAA